MAGPVRFEETTIPGSESPRSPRPDEQRTTLSSPGSEFYALLSNGGDALAVACWLTNGVMAGTTGTRGLEDIVSVHNRTDDPHRTRTDEDQLDGKLAKEPQRCLLTGSPTQSHEVLVPFRYAPLLEDYPFTYQDVPAIPERTAGFRAVISHSAWTEHDITEDMFYTPPERTGPGKYELAEDVYKIIDGVAVEDMAWANRELPV